MLPELQLKEGWITVICLLLMLLCVAWSIQIADWTDGLAILQGMVLVGALSGIVLAKSRVPNRMAHLLSMLGGFALGAYLTSSVLAQAAELSASAALVEVEARLRVLFFIPFTEGLVADNHVFLLLLALLLWFVAYFCAWAIFRWQRVWWAVMVCGLALILNSSYTSANLTGFLIAFLVFALLLVVRASVAFYEQEWRIARVGYSPELISNALQAGLIISVATILLAWLAPVALASRPLQPFWDKVGEPWRRFQDRSSQIFQDLNYQNEPPLISLGDRRMWFGGAVELSDTPIADIRASAGRYWRVMVFHEYLSNGWMNTDPDTILVDRDKQTLAFPEFDLRNEVTQTVTLYRGMEPADALIAAGQPLRAGLPLRAAVAFVTLEEDMIRADPSLLPPAPGDPSALYSRYPLQPGDTYRVLSSLTTADEESLRKAGTDYPNWVKPRYLQLPDSLPERVRVLAQQITADQTNPYDKAKAIESYLRKISYNNQIDRPGLGQDGVDYFLFEVGEGYCEYFSSAMVVMLREVGVPARHVHGYSQRHPEEGVYHVLESNGHAWPEVFFPGLGWVEFEPTSSEPALVRARSQTREPTRRTGAQLRRDMRPMPDDVYDIPIEPDSPEPLPTPQPQRLWQRIGRWGWLAIDLVALVLVLFALMAARHRRQNEGLSVAERVYEDLVNWVRYLLRMSPLAHQTPHEYAGTVVEAAPRSREAVVRIADLYVQERFGDQTAPAEDAEAAWRQAWRALWRGWLGRRVDVVRRFWWRLVPPAEWPEP